MAHTTTAAANFARAERRLAAAHAHVEATKTAMDTARVEAPATKTAYFAHHAHYGAIESLRDAEADYARAEVTYDAYLDYAHGLYLDDLAGV